jgi:hypothetical protein
MGICVLRRRKPLDMGMYTHRRSKSLLRGQGRVLHCAYLAREGMVGVGRQRQSENPVEVIQLRSGWTLP